MKVTGYKLQRAAKSLRTTIDVLSKQFNENITQFPNDKDKPDLMEIWLNLRIAEVSLATVNHYQAKYNQMVHVSVLGVTMALDRAIKLVGPAARLEKKWYKALGEESSGRRFFSDPKVERDPTKEYAVRSKSLEFCQAQAKKAGEYAAAVREAVQTGNAQEIEFEGIEPGDLEV